MGEPEGYVKLIVGGTARRNTGDLIIGPEATELIAELGLAMNPEATFEEIEVTFTRIPREYPSKLEAALRDAIDPCASF